MMQEHHSKAIYSPANEHIKHAFNREERRNPLTFKISKFEIVFNVVRPKSQNPCVCAGIDKEFP